MNELITMVFVEQPLALPGPAKNFETQPYLNTNRNPLLRRKLDGVAPLLTDSPPTSFTTLCEDFFLTHDMLHMTGGGGGEPSPKISAP